MLLHELGGRLTPGEVPMPRPGPNEALVRVRAVGVGLTLAIMRSNPGLVTHYPRIIGHEVAGDLVEVGSEVEGFHAGDRVTCHFYLTCKVCRLCRSGRETLCANFKGYVGMACDGGFAEYMALPALNLCRLPAGLGYLDGAISADAICTPLHVCRAEAQIGPGDDVLIVGNRPKAVFKVDPTFPVDPGTVLYKGLEIHGSRYVSMAELAQTLEIVRQGRVRPIVTRTFPLEGADEALCLVEEGRVAGRAALILD
jgi:D-arabinose 1-dehydrogenase-like Zn-dependent alcohol dehydrogenase